MKKLTREQKDILIGITTALSILTVGIGIGAYYGHHVGFNKGYGKCAQDFSEMLYDAVLHSPHKRLVYVPKNCVGLGLKVDLADLSDVKLSEVKLDLDKQ